MDTDNFKLDPPTFAGPDGSAPVVGDRYVHRDRCCEVIIVTPANVVLLVATKDSFFRKTVSLQEFAVLEKRSLDAGAVFKPAPSVAHPCPSVFNPAP